MKTKNQHGGKRAGAGRPKEEPTKQMRIPVSLVDTVAALMAGTNPDAQRVAAAQAVLSAWQASAATHSGPRWEKVNRLLAELQNALS